MNTELNNTDQDHDSDDFERSIPVEIRAALQAIEDRRAAQEGQPFDPTELLRLATEQWPDMQLVAASFARCTLEWPASELYTHFLGYAERKALRHDRTEFLEHPTLGELAVDLVCDTRVEGGVRVLGIEYLDRVFARGAEQETHEDHWPLGWDLALLEEDAEAQAEEPGQHMRIVHLKETLPSPTA